MVKVLAVDDAIAVLVHEYAFERLAAGVIHLFVEVERVLAAAYGVDERELTTNAADASIVQAIISLAHSLRLKVVAEGVETAEQLQRLRELGCDQYQGFYRSKALPAREVEQSIRQNMVPDTVADDPFMKTQSKLAAYIPRKRS